MCQRSDAHRASLVTRDGCPGRQWLTVTPVSDQGTRVGALEQRNADGVDVSRRGLRVFASAGDSVASIAFRQPATNNGGSVATLTIRGIDDDLRARLRVRAAEHGRSMEAEVRAILKESLTKPRPASRLGSRIHQRFTVAGDVDLDVPVRTEQPRAPALPE